jgi:hypothetical protein
MAYTIGGLILALGITIAAAVRSRSAGGFYAEQWYGMSPAVHLRYAAVSLAFAAFFGASYAYGQTTAGIAGLALYALIAVFYLSSFLRGAPDRDE